MIGRPPKSPLFPYPPLSRSLGQIRSNGAAPRHVAIIMDGNGRWARERNLPRPFGHRAGMKAVRRSEEHTSELQSQSNLVCRLLLEKKKKQTIFAHHHPSPGA